MAYCKGTKAVLEWVDGRKVHDGARLRCCLHDGHPGPHEATLVRGPDIGKRYAWPVETEKTVEGSVGSLWMMDTECKRLTQLAKDRFPSATFFWAVYQLQPRKGEGPRAKLTVHAFDEQPESAALDALGDDASAAVRP